MSELPEIEPTDTAPPASGRDLRRQVRARRKLRRRRRRRRAYIRSVFFLPSLATLGNLVCGFGAIYVAGLTPWAATDTAGRADQDPWTLFFADHRLMVACYLIFLAMLFDAVDGALARLTRHTTDFGGQLDSLADVVSFGVAPALIMLHTFKGDAPQLPMLLTRTVWALAALYAACAAMRLARFNVANDHGEEHHFSFLGLPSPGAAAVVVSFVLMQRELSAISTSGRFAAVLFYTATALLPIIVLASGLLMISAIRYPHFVNRYLKGKSSPGKLLAGLALLLGLVVAHRYTLGVLTLLYATSGFVGWSWWRFRNWISGRRGLPAKPSAA